MRKCQDWIDSYFKLTENTEPPDIFHKWVAISCIAACMQRKCVLPWGRLRFYANLYVVLIAPPGRARKSTAMEPVMSFLDEPRLNIKIAAESITREQLIRELMKSQEMVTTNDGKLVSHCSLTICNSELSVFLGYQNPQLIDDLVDWYDCKRRWSYRTKNAGEYELAGVWVNLLGATTPDVIRSCLPQTAIGGGLTSRMIFIYAANKRRPISNPLVTKEDIILEENLLHDLEQITLLCGDYVPTQDWIDVRDEWYMLNDANPPFDDVIFAKYCERRIATVSKLSIIMAASHSDRLVVTGEDFLRGVTFLEEAEELMPMALSGIGSGRHADVLARLMAEISVVKECKLDTLMWKFRNDLTHWEMERLIGSLEAMKFCMYISNTRKIIYNEEFKGR